jgi:multidrug efflux pump subunit AcrB
MAQRSSGGDSSHLGEVNVELLGAENRDVGSAELVSRWREIVGEVPGAVSLTFRANIFSAGEPVSVQLAHRDFDVLLMAVDRLKAVIAEYPGTKDVADSFLPGKKELKLSLTPVGRAAGLTLSDLARQVRAGFYGQEVQRIQRGRDDIRVMVRYPEAERRSRGDIDEMRVRLPGGTEVPFTTVAVVEEGRGYAVINRTDRRRVVTVSSDVDEEVANANEISSNLRNEVLPALVKEYPGLTFDFEGEQRQQTESLDSMKINFLVAQLAAPHHHVGHSLRARRCGLRPHFDGPQSDHVVDVRDGGPDRGRGQRLADSDRPHQPHEDRWQLGRPGAPRGR